MLTHSLQHHNEDKMCGVSSHCLSFDRSLRVSLGAPSKLNIKLELFIPPSWCQAPTITIPSPISTKRGFHKIKMQCECQQIFPHARHRGQCENTSLMLQIHQQYYTVASFISSVKLSYFQENMVNLESHC
jgi:hypothetical protein